MVLGDAMRILITLSLREFASPGIPAETGAMKAASGERRTKLDKANHVALVLWACDCAERVLPHFEEQHPNDERPRKAIDAGRAWARGEIAFGDVRAVALAAHAAAYAVKAAPDAAAEREWKIRRLPEHLRSVAFPAANEVGCG